MAELGTATLNIRPELDPEATATMLSEIRTFEPNHRIEALSKAIESVRTFDAPPGHEFIVSRAEAFLTFLDGND